VSKILSVSLGIVILLLLAAWLKLRGPDISYETLEAKYADGASHFVDLPGGFHVHYRDEGDLNQPLLVLLHGFGDSFTSWEGWVAALKTKFHIISVDFPGHGLTRAPVGFQLSGDGLADFVDDFANPRAQSQATADLIGTIKVPTLVLYGESDPLIEPASARKFATAIRGATLITYPRVGHLPQIEIPQRSAGDAGTFLGTVLARR
jgi:pimeloyl-ACP methyl ester carboxylesterase